MSLLPSYSLNMLNSIFNKLSWQDTRKWADTKNKSIQYLLQTHNSSKIKELLSVQCSDTIKADSDILCILIINSERRDVIVIGQASGEICVYNMQDYRKDSTYKEHTEMVNCLEELPGNQGIFASGSLDREIKIWDINSNVSLKTINTSLSMYSLNVIKHNKGFTVASGHYNDIIKLYSNKTNNILDFGREAVELECDESYSYIKTMINIRYNNKEFLISGSEAGDIRVWDLNSYQVISTIHAHIHCVNGLSHVKENLIISCGRDKTVKIWDFISGRLIKVYKDLDSTVHSLQNITTEMNENMFLVGGLNGYMLLAENQVMKASFPRRCPTLKFVYMRNNSKHSFVSYKNDKILRLWK